MTSSSGSRFALTDERVRHLTADALGLEPLQLQPLQADGRAAPDELGVQIDDDDPILEKVRRLLQTYGGIIFFGPPGTSKSWYAAGVGTALVGGDASRVRFVQFHPSYQYEDFVEGFVPFSDGAGFEMTPKHFLEMCAVAEADPDVPAVLVIDELSRGDPGRVFGEALTYMEKTKRGIRFSLSSGRECRVPDNLLVLATMNPLDRGVDEVDAAFDRRFAKIAMDPDESLLAHFMEQAGMDPDLRARVLEFFRAINGQVAASNPFAILGHTYFLGARDEDDLRQLWEHQLRFHFDKAFRLDGEGRAEVGRLWNEVLRIRPNETETTDGEGVRLGEEPVDSDEADQRS